MWVRFLIGGPLTSFQGSLIVLGGSGYELQSGGCFRLWHAEWHEEGSASPRSHKDDPAVRVWSRLVGAQSLGWVRVVSNQKQLISLLRFP